MTEPDKSIVFVGELNPYGCDPDMALYHLPRHASGNRLREHLGLTDATYSQIKKVNLCTGKWSLKAAREACWDIEVTYDVLVLLGAKVRSAFKVPDLQLFCATWQRPTYIWLPHPSGLNRVWNQPDARAREVLAEVVPWISWGEQG